MLLSVNMIRHRPIQIVTLKSLPCNFEALLFAAQPGNCFLNDSSLGYGYHGLPDDTLAGISSARFDYNVRHLIATIHNFKTAFSFVAEDIIVLAEADHRIGVTFVVGYFFCLLLD
jgi:hypothetical protein